MKTFDQAWAEYEAQQAALRAAWRERQAALKARMAAQPARSRQAPIQIGACCPAAAYAEDSALGRNTD